MLCVVCARSAHTVFSTSYSPAAVFSGQSSWRLHHPFTCKASFEQLFSTVQDRIGQEQGQIQNEPAGGSTSLLVCPVPGPVRPRRHAGLCHGQNAPVTGPELLNGLVLRPRGEWTPEVTSASGANRLLSDRGRTHGGSLPEPQNARRCSYRAAPRASRTRTKMERTRGG